MLTGDVTPLSVWRQPLSIPIRRIGLLIGRATTRQRIIGGACTVLAVVLCAFALRSKPAPIILPNNTVYDVIGPGPTPFGVASIEAKAPLNINTARLLRLVQSQLQRAPISGGVLPQFVDCGGNHAVYSLFATRLGRALVVHYIEIQNEFFAPLIEASLRANGLVTPKLQTELAAAIAAVAATSTAVTARATHPPESVSPVTSLSGSDSSAGSGGSDDLSSLAVATIVPSGVPTGLRLRAAYALSPSDAQIVATKTEFSPFGAAAGGGDGRGGVAVRWFGLSSSRKTVEFQSDGELTHLGRAKTDGATGEKDGRVSDVPVFALDFIVESTITEPVVCLKIDVEGFEIEVLKGASALFADPAGVQSVLIEIAPVRWAASAPTGTDLTALVKSNAAVLSALVARYGYSAYILPLENDCTWPLGAWAGTRVNRLFMDSCCPVSMQALSAGFGGASDQYVTGDGGAPMRLLRVRQTEIESVLHEMFVENYSCDWWLQRVPLEMAPKL